MMAAAAVFRVPEMTSSMLGLHRYGDVMPNITLAGLAWAAAKACTFSAMARSWRGTRGWVGGGGGGRRRQTASHVNVQYRAHAHDPYMVFVDHTLQQHWPMQATDRDLGSERKGGEGRKKRRRARKQGQGGGWKQAKSLIGTPHTPRQGTR
jgi:hypothetical protein